METVSEYKNSPDPLLRATYWLIRFAWDNPKRFETLQELSKEVEAVSKQNVDLVVALKLAEVRLSVFNESLEDYWDADDEHALRKIEQALAQVKGDQS